jgi:hypothetical protein
LFFISMRLQERFVDVPFRRNASVLVLLPLFWLNNFVVYDEIF